MLIIKIGTDQFQFYLKKADSQMRNSCVLIYAGRLTSMPFSGNFHLHHFLMEVWLHITEKVELGRLHGLPEITLEFTLNEIGKKPNLLSDVLRGSHMK